MIEDARVLLGDRLLEADVAIIGGGAAGIAMALSFANSAFRVVVLESGGLQYESDTQSLYRGKIIGLRYEPLDLCRVRTLGGSTDKRGWAGWCKVFHGMDFERREWIQHSGWPISKRDLASHYEEALKTVSLPRDLEEVASLESQGKDCLTLAGKDCVNDLVGLSTAPHLAAVWLESLRAAKNIRVILHSNVVRIETDETGRVVTSIGFSSLNHRTFNIAPRYTVLAAGGIENARLLLASNQGVRPGLGNESDWVGRCFMDHPRYAWGQITSVKDPRQLLRYNPTHGVGQRRMGVPLPGQKPLLGAGLSLSEEAQRRERVLGSRTWILPVAPQGERVAGRELREVILWALRGRVPSDIALRSGKIIADIPNAMTVAVAHLKSVAGHVRRWHFVTILEPEPNKDSRLILAKDCDPLGLPRVILDWRLTPLVERTLQVTQETIVKELKSIGIECFVQGPGGPKANQAVSDPRWVWHHMGTTRMSDDPNDGVVDPNCRVHGMKNLYIAGSSVFPTCSTDMPTLTVIALAHRLADYLKLEMKRRVKIENRPTALFGESGSVASAN